MKPVAIIANPASGKDIRRLVAYGSVFDNNEKVNIVRRVLLGLDSVGVEEVVFMPDYFAMGPRAMEDLAVSLKTSTLEMVMEGTQDDSTVAAQRFSDMGVACIVTLGGDGTNRAVAKTCGNTPILPISTGTNNVFPTLVEGTLAGIAAGVVASGAFAPDETMHRAPLLEIHRDSRPMDIALVDVVVSKPGFIGSRAIWDVSSILEIFLARADPGNIGFSSIGGNLCPLKPDSGKGMYLRIGPSRTIVKAPIAPGLVREVPIEQHRVFEPHEAIPVSRTPAVIAVDGEREHVVGKEEQLSVRINVNGPRVVDIPRTLRRASEESFFSQR